MILTSLSHAGLIAALAGPISHHLIWIRCEWDAIFYKIAAAALVFQPLALLLLRLGGARLVPSLIALSVLQTSYLVSLFTSIAIYRLFFHSTGKFPGPFWARLWQWWKVYQFAKSEKGYGIVYELHQKYGDVVRIGPRHISLNNVEAITPIYGSNSACFKSVQYELGTEKGVGAIRDFDKHHVRRTIWDRGLNGKGELPIEVMMKCWSSHSLACQDFVPRMSRLSDLFVQKLREYNGQPVVINDWCHYITFDVMGDVAFGRSYGQLEAGRVHPGIATINQWLSLAVLILQVPWLLGVMQRIPVENPDETMKKFAAASLREREQEEPEHPDVMSHILQARGEKSKWLLDHSALVGDTIFLQIAGSDTSYSAFVHMFYYLAKDPQLQESLRQEVKDAMSVDGLPNWSKLTQLPLLDGILQETLRMHPPVPQGMGRNTPRTGAQIGNVFVPGDVIVSVPTWSIHHDERYFERANEWIPERWFSKPELIKDRRAHIPFSIGPFNCAGKYFAVMESKVFITKVVTAFDIAFAPGEDGTNMLSNSKDHFTMWLPDLRLILTPR